MLLVYIGVGMWKASPFGLIRHWAYTEVFSLINANLVMFNAAEADLSKETRFRFGSSFTKGYFLLNFQEIVAFFFPCIRHEATVTRAEHFGHQLMVHPTIQFGQVYVNNSPAFSGIFEMMRIAAVFFEFAKITVEYIKLTLFFNKTRRRYQQQSNCPLLKPFCNPFFFGPTILQP